MLGLGGAADTLSSVEEDLVKAYKQYNNLHGFSVARENSRPSSLPARVLGPGAKKDGCLRRLGFSVAF